MLEGVDARFNSEDDVDTTGFGGWDVRVLKLRGAEPWGVLADG